MQGSVAGNGTIAAECRLPPAAADEDAVARGRERLEQLVAAAEGDAAARLQQAQAQPDAEALLAAVFGNSPFLSACLLRTPEQWADLMLDGPDRCLEVLLDGLPAPGARLRPQEAAPLLRQARNRAALIVGLADLSGAWALDRVVTALSAFADAAIGVALESALAAQATTEAPQDADLNGCGFVLLAMGKLGAGELNYSSDVDVIALYDAERLGKWLGRPADAVQQAAVRATQALTRLLQDRTRDGYVFRTDLRLRPDPGATQVALPVGAAISYYESYGQNWERAAMIKARPCAGDLDLGRHFLDEITPFVWRRNMDFAAIADIMAVKRQIHSHKGHGQIAAAGHDLKVGRGGIREIEFFAQTQQLIAGGREPALRLRGTVATLHALADIDRIDIQTCREMEDAYRFLRIAEHRLQMIDDQQTQKVPAEAEALSRYAAFMGFPDRAALEATLTRVLTMVSRHFDELFADPEPEARQSGSLVFTGTDHDPDTLENLAGMGFGDPEAVSRIVRDWHRSRYPALKTRAARERLTGLMPDLLAAFAATPNPDLAFKGFDEFLSRMPAGIQLFALLLANRSLLGLLAEIMGGFPDLARHLSRYPILFDAMLDSDFYAPLPDRGELQAELQTRLSHARHEEDVLRAACRWVRDRELQTGVQALHGMAEIGQAMGWLTDVADCALDAALANARAQHEASHGRLPGGRFVVLAMGRLGAREMLAESDLDLVFVYDHAADAEASDGPKPLAAGTYFARLSQRLISAVTAMTPDGRLYEVDMRLRPSGKSGPVATRLAAFAKYYAEDAQTWELMALTKARLVCGDESLADDLAAQIHDLFARERDADSVRADAAAMRRRMRETHPGSAPWDLKHGPGGLADMDFIWQSLALIHAAATTPAQGDGTPAAGAAVSALVAAGALTADEAAALRRARDLANTVMIAQRLAAGRGGTTDMDSPQFQVTLARAAGATDFETLSSDLRSARDAVIDLYVRTLGEGTES
ncbi:bifunctional [glutamine synthetase] adenylyltransferase/[glutamine synthetase]-adenylyl-L-tyrosine phosphorylase [Marinibaculum pumilum]|uniref:Bifunctional glutamine synthetase adenylyltransferase/adenylyl-removing enzyme n=1 Tax=Marinibaculum pumilum TaxID=1766165 RepID=A0ABV7KWV7_9PROT